MHDEQYYAHILYSDFVQYVVYCACNDTDINSDDPVFCHLTIMYTD